MVEAQDQTTESVAQPNQDPEPHFDWLDLLFFVPAIGLLIIIFMWDGVIRGGFQLLLDNLPLTLPVLSVVMAVLLDPRHLGTLRGWADLTLPIALGLVSFAIWYFVASQGAGDYILVSERRVLTKEYNFLLLIASFVWAGWISVVAIISDSRATTSRRWWRLRLVNFAFSVALLLLPFALFQDKEAVEEQIGQSLDFKDYSVAIPYRDPSLNQYLGRSTDPLTQVYTFRALSARTHAEARAVAIDSFRVLPQALQFAQPNQRQEGPARMVEILESEVVAQVLGER